MTVSSTTRRVQANGNGSTTAFNYNFEIFNQSQIDVYVGTTLQTITTHYTVSGVGADAGGTVTFVTAPADATVVTIVSNIPVERTTSFATGGAFKASTVNDELDSLIAMVNELEGNLGRTVRLPVTDGTLTLELPVAADRASKFLSFDASGNAQTATNVGEWEGNWVTATAYVHNDIVKDSSTSSIYIVLADYTSGATVAADVANGDLGLVIDGTQVSQALSWATYAENLASQSTGFATSVDGSTAVRSALYNATLAGTHKTDAETAQAAAEAAQTAAETAKTNAETAETNAETAETNAETAQTASVTAQTNAETAETGAETARDEAVAAAGAINGKSVASDDADTSVETERTTNNNTVHIKAGGVDQITATATDVTIAGNFTVNGTTTTIDTTNTTITDKILELSSGRTGTPSHDSGMVVIRGNSPNAFWGWDEQNNGFTAKTGTFTGSDTGNLSGSLANALFGALTVSGDILPVDDSTAQDIGTSGNKFNDVHATTFNGIATSAQYADLAEHMEADAEYERGTLVEIGGKKEITQCNKSGCKNVFGVISTNPAYSMNAGKEYKGNPMYPAVALAGRVPVKVQGTINKGDRLVSAGNGQARRQTWLDKISGASVVGIVLFTISDGTAMAFVSASVA